MAGGVQTTIPVECNMALVIVLTIQSPSALKNQKNQFKDTLFKLFNKLTYYRV